MNLERMLATLPEPEGATRLEPSFLAACIEACAGCAQACSACADACLGEAQLGELRRCIRLNLDCADICDATGRVLLRQVEPNGSLQRAQLEACALACATCAEECQRHARHHEHCRVCAEACRECETQCHELLRTWGTTMAVKDAPRRHS